MERLDGRRRSSLIERIAGTTRTPRIVPAQPSPRRSWTVQYRSNPAQRSTGQGRTEKARADFGCFGRYFERKNFSNFRKTIENQLNLW